MAILARTSRRSVRQLHPSGYRALRQLIAVVTCHQRTYPKNDLAGGHKNGESRIDVVRATWYKNWFLRYADKIDVMFFLGRGERSPEGYEIHLDCDDSYYGLPEKVRQVYNWCYRAGYDQVIKVDDDVFLYVGRLLANPSDVDYRGFAIESEIRYASGTCYQLSRRAMKFVADAEIPQGEWREDRHVGQVLLNNGIKLTDEPRFHCCHCDACNETMPQSERISSHTSDPRQMYRLMENI